jgi:hypothetical protein
MSLMDKKVVDKQTIVLKPNSTLSEARDTAEKKKTSMFGSVFNRPKSDEINISSIDLYYESYWLVSGKYSGDYFRKSVYEFSTDPEVTEVIIGNGNFPVRTESGTWNKFRDSVKIGEKNNKVDIPVEEHVKIDIEEKIIFNSQGNEIKFKYKIESNNIENFPNDILKNKNNIRESTVNEEQIIEKMTHILRQEMEDNIRMIHESITIDKLEQIFVPVYEARCIDSKNTIKILRIDAMDLKIL